MNQNLTITPMGGLGEIGMNSMAFSTSGSTILIDCGLMFPEDYLFGVDVAIPRFDRLIAQKRNLKGILLTHGHEDHIGALPWLLPYVEAPMYGSRFTLGLVENKLREHNLNRWADLRPVKAGERIELGDFACTFLPVCHSIIEGFGLGLETPLGRVIHTGDFKIDRNPLDGHATDLEAFRKFAAPGTLLMLSDSTNVEQDGFALTEHEIQASLHEIFSTAKGRILVSLFASHIQRIQEIINLARTFGRKVTISGKNLLRNIELARNLGHLHVPSETMVQAEELSNFHDNKMVVLLTGSQGEPLAALSRISMDEHRYLTIHKGDLVLFSSRFIPGNIMAITRVINRLYRLGAEVLYEKVQTIHASGHAHREELRIMLQIVQPKFFIPVHGEYRHMIKHKRLAIECGVDEKHALIIENGQPVTFLSNGSWYLEKAVSAERILVDGKGVGDVGRSVLKERQLLAGEGMVIVIVVIDEKTRTIIHGPDVVSKGFIFEQNYSHLLDDAKCVILDIFEDTNSNNFRRIKEKIRSSLRSFFRKVLERDPIIVPVIISI